MNDTTFVREKKTRDYSLIDNTFLRDDSLSMSAKGLFSYFLFLPDDWVIYQSELCKHFSNGRDAIRNATKELEAHGYLEKKQIKDEKNRFAGYKYIIHEKPITPEKKQDEKKNSESKDNSSAAGFPSAEFQQRGFQKPLFPAQRNPTLPITDNKPNTNKPSNALNSFANAHEFKDAGACTTAEPQTPPSKADCPSLPHTEASPDNENSSDIAFPKTDTPDDIKNSGISRSSSCSPAYTETLDIFREQEETTPSVSDPKSSEDRQAASEGASPLDFKSLETHSAAGGGFPFAEEPRKARKASPKRKSARKTLTDGELDGYFAPLDPETVRRMHEITESLYKKARIADPLYVRSGNYLRNQTKKLTDFMASSGRTADEVEATFNFGFTDSFWCNVVVSVDVFLRNYTKILQKMRERGGRSIQKPRHTSMVDAMQIGRNDYTEDF